MSVYMLYITETDRVLAKLECHGNLLNLINYRRMNASQNKNKDS